MVNKTSIPSKILTVFKSPLLWLGIILLSLSTNIFYNNGSFNGVIRSDGRGYYAYLPAMLIYNDPSYELSTASEKKYLQKGSNQLYLYKDDNGEILNKYFPGVAILQLPFFGAACLQSWLTNQPIDGYSGVFQFWFLIGAIFYALLGIYFFRKFLIQLFPEKIQLINWFLPLIVVATPLLFYFTIPLSFGHIYSFFLFGVLAYITLKLKHEVSFKLMLLLGITLGLITLVRPTNILVVLIIPFLLETPKKTMELIQKTIVQNPKYILGSLVSFFSVISILFILWKWQSGRWVVWSYNGEGFDFLNPKLLENLFSFRIGLFLHTPILILSIIGSIYFIKKNRFQALFFWLYFLANAWVISSWWCWDYESAFGNRPFTEHLFFLIIPVFFLLEKFPKATLSLSLIFVLLGAIRYGEFYSGMMYQQRFTSSNYFSSLQFWDKNNAARWQYTRACPPHGEVKKESILVWEDKETEVTKDKEFLFTVRELMPKPRTNERFYYRVRLDKKSIEDNFEGVYLIIEGTSNNTDYHTYSSTELFNDRFEGIGEWKYLVFEGQILDNFQDLDTVTMYIWNKNNKSFSLKNIRFSLFTYSS